MNHLTLTIVWKIVSRKFAVILLLAISAAAFATLGDGKVKEPQRMREKDSFFHIDLVPPADPPHGPHEIPKTIHGYQCCLIKGRNKEGKGRKG